MPKPRAYASVFSPRKQESTFGVVTPAAVTDLAANGIWLPCTEADFAEIDYNMIDTSDELDGNSTPALYNVEQVNGSLARKYYATTEALAFYVALQLGNVTVSAASTASNEVWTLTLTGGASAGAFTMTWKGSTTTPIDTATLSLTTIQNAFNALGSVVALGGSAVVTGTGPYVITLSGGTFANTMQPLPTINIVTTLVSAGTVAIATTTDGGAATQYTHTAQFPSECTLNPPSFTLNEGLRCSGSTGTYKQITGCTVEQQEIEFSSKGWITHTVGLKFRDEVDNASYTFPGAPTAVTRLKGSHVTANLGATYTTAIPSTDLRSGKITMTSGLVTPPTINDTDLVTEFQYGEKKPDVAVEITVKGDKSSTYYGFFRACRFGTRYKFKLIIQPNSTPQRTVTFSMDQVFVKAKQTKSGNETTLQLMLMPETNSTDGSNITGKGPCTWTFQTAVVSYLNAI